MKKFLLHYLYISLWSWENVLCDFARSCESCWFETSEQEGKKDETKQEKKRSNLDGRRARLFSWRHGRRSPGELGSRASRRSRGWRGRGRGRGGFLEREGTDEEVAQRAFFLLTGRLIIEEQIALGENGTIVKNQRRKTEPKSDQQRMNIKLFRFNPTRTSHWIIAWIVDRKQIEPRSTRNEWTQNLLDDEK